MQDSISMIYLQSRTVLRANDHRDVYNNNRGCFFTAPVIFFYNFHIYLLTNHPHDGILYKDVSTPQS